VNLPSHVNRTVKTIVTHSEGETAAAGRRFAATLPRGAVVLLEGELGAGKTAFVRGMAEGLGIDPQDVTSPTFTLVQEYRSGNVVLFHVDLYRLSAAEADDLGLDEMAEQGRAMAIEWPDRLRTAIGDSVRVRISHADGDQRIICIG
jgi:tRNA threonylcarbamoyladenosine biosynthesis protein TsaE